MQIYSWRVWENEAKDIAIPTLEGEKLFVLITRRNFGYALQIIDVMHALSFLFPVSRYRAR